MSFESAGDVRPGTTRYVVSEPHNHKSLDYGDVVIMVETPTYENLLYREFDATLHELEDDVEQYVHLVPIREHK